MNQKKTTLDPSILKEIESMGGSVSKAARALGLSYPALRARVDQSTPTATGVAQLARKDIAQYAVAAKRTGSEWPRSFEGELDKARRDYDAGTHEMAQGRTNGWIIQYSFPRLIKVKRNKLFNSVE